jgi:putative MFS transporter
MIKALPESPRWLASRGRNEEADRVMTRIEGLVSDHGARPLPPIPDNVAPAVASKSRIRELFQGIYLRRTLSLWVLWFCAYLISYGMSGWLPSIFRTVYHASVTAANAYGFVYNLVGLLVLVATAYLIDRVGRKRAYAVGFLFGAAMLFAVMTMSSPGAMTVLVIAMVASLGLSIVPGTLGMYTAENYPNHLRAVGSGVSSIPQRLSSVVGPYIVGLMLPAYGVGGVFGMFAAFAVVGGLTAAVFSTETAGRTLEELSPAYGSGVA